jgi:RNA polymerase sigma factor (sigma-70 family)
VSPLAVRRYRAERLLREEFGRLQARVTGVVARRLAAAGVALDQRDLEACYTTAWQGLYEAVLEGRHIVNPAGWLVLVTYRRAIDEQRSRDRAGQRVELAEDTAPRHELGEARPAATHAATVDGDFATALDDRERLRQLFEGLRSRLTDEEREAAVLCYLHGLTRAEAAATMGISRRRMCKLMDGRGPGHAGASGKLGSLVASIREGRWCEQQGSLMRGLAFGILDPRGERYRLALAHSAECPACRAYVASLRGLAGALPPALLPGGLAAGILARVATGAGSTTGAGLAGVAHGAGAGGGAPAGASASAGGGLLGSAGAAGAAGGSGWVLAGGPFGAKLAAGCLLALGIGAGCVGLDLHGNEHGGRRAARVRPAHAGRRPDAARRSDPAGAAAKEARVAASRVPAKAAPAGTPLSEAARASREFGPEQAAGSAQARESPAPARARAASSGGPGAGAAPQAQSNAATASREAGRAEREFGPG